MENHEPRSVPPPRRHDTPPSMPAPGPYPEELGDADFPTMRRGGYDRAAVDAYVARVERLVAEMGAASDPDEAVRRALDRVGEETAGILRHAQETAASMMSRSEAQASERMESAERRAREREDEAELEAERLKAQAEADVRRLDADNDRLWEERQRLIDETRKLSASLRRVAEEADQLFPPEPLGSQVESELGVEPEREAEPEHHDTVRMDEGAEPGAGRP